ncbi:MAG: trypsin-like peptidase domain-containing protein [Planctomycetota bacterium]
MRTWRWTLLLLLPLFATVALAGDEGTLLLSGRAVRSRLPADGNSYETFRIEVPRGATRLVVRVDATGDADLYVKAGGPIVDDWLQEATAYSNGATGEEVVTLTSSGSPRLVAGTYYIDVVHGEGRKGAPLSFTIEAAVLGDNGPGAEAPPEMPGGPGDEDDIEGTFSDDFQTTLTMPSDTANYRTFRMKVGADVTSIRMTLRGASVDMDLFVRYGATMESWNEADHSAITNDADETLILSRDGVPRLRSGVYYVDVARRVDDGARVTFAVEFTRGYEGPDVHGNIPIASSLPDVTGEIHSNSLFTVSIDGTGPNYRTYVIHVPKTARSLLITAKGASGDIDLYLRKDYPIDDYRSDPHHSANGSRSDEQLFVDRSSSPSLQGGMYYLDIAAATQGRDVGTMEVSVTFDAARPDPIPATTGPVLSVRLGERVEADLAEEGRKAGRYSFEVPRGASRLFVQVIRASRDIDLFLRHGTPITDYDDTSGHDYKAVTNRLVESLTIDASSSPPLRPGTYYLDVASLVGADENVAYTFIVTVDEPPELRPGDFPLPPYHKPEDLTPLERSLQAVVQIASDNGSGSGTCVSPNGYIVSNYHVLEDEGRLQTTDVFVSFVRSFDQPPEQIFVAEVVEKSKELDLVLLKIVRDIHDHELPIRLTLPWLALGNANELRHGDPLMIAGFPSVGGFESRTSISVTSGIVSGFTTDAAGNRVWIKTDARINAGNSGGTALNAKFEYVGVPSREQIAEDDELGYSRPTNVIPEAWREMIERAQR